MITPEVFTQYEPSPGTPCLHPIRSRTPRQSFETFETCRHTSQSRRHKRNFLFPDRGQIFCPRKPNVSFCRRPCTAPVPTLHALQASCNQRPRHRDDVYCLSQTPGASYLTTEYTDTVPIFPRSPIYENPQTSIPISAPRQLEICGSLQTPEICYVSNISKYVCYKTGNVCRNSKSYDTICHLLQTSVTECGSSYATVCQTSQQSCTMCTSLYPSPVVTPPLVPHNVCYPKQYARNIFPSTQEIRGKNCKPHDSVMAEEPDAFLYSPSCMILNAPPQISDSFFCYPSNSCLIPQKSNICFTPLLRTSVSHHSLIKCRSSHSFCRNLHQRDNPFVYSFPSSTNCRRVRFSDSICRHSQFESSCSNSNSCRSSKSFHSCHPVCSSQSGLSSHTSATSHSSASCPSRISNIVCQTTEQREHTLRPYHTMFRQQKKSTVQFQQSQRNDGQIISTIISDDDGGCYEDNCDALQQNVDTFQYDEPPGYISRPQRNVGAKFPCPPCPEKNLQPPQPPGFNYRTVQPYSNTRNVNMPPNFGTPNQITQKKFQPFAPPQRKNNLNKICSNISQQPQYSDNVTYCTRDPDVTYQSQDGGNMSPAYQNNPESSILCPTFQNQAAANRPLPFENPSFPQQTPQRIRRQVQVPGRITTPQQGKTARATQISCNTCDPCKTANMQSMQPMQSMQSMQSAPSSYPLQSNPSGGNTVQTQTPPQNVPGEVNVYCPNNICPAKSFGKITTQSSPSANVNYPSYPPPQISRPQPSDPIYLSTDTSNVPIQSSKIYCPKSSENIICHCPSGGNINIIGDSQSQYSGTPVTAGNRGGNLPPLGTTSQTRLPNNYYTDNTGNTNRYFEIPENNCRCPSKFRNNMTPQITDNMSSEITGNMTSEILDNMTSDITDNMISNCDCKSFFSGDKACKCPINASNTGVNITPYETTTRQMSPSGILNFHSQNARNINRHIEFSEPANISGDKSCICPSRIAGDTGVNVSPSGRINRQISPYGNTGYQMQKPGIINQNVDRSESPQRNICHCSPTMTDNATMSQFPDNSQNFAEPHLYGDKKCNCPSVTGGNIGTNNQPLGTTNQLMSPVINYPGNTENIGLIIEECESAEKRICFCKPQTNESYHSQNSDIHRNIDGPVSSEKILYNSASQTSGNILCDCKSRVSGDGACNCASRNVERLVRSVSPSGNTERVVRTASPSGRTNRVLLPSDNANYQSQHSVKDCKAKYGQPCRNTFGRRSPTTGNISRPVSPSGNVVQRVPQSMHQPSQVYQPPQNPQPYQPPQMPQAYQPPQIPQAYQPSQIHQAFQPPTNIRPCQTSNIPCNPQCPRKKCAPLGTSDASHSPRATMIPGKSNQSGTFYQPQAPETRPCSCPSATSSNTSCDCSTLGDEIVSPQDNINVGRNVSQGVKFSSTSPATIKIVPSPTASQNLEPFGDSGRSSSPSRRSPSSGGSRHTSKHPGDTYLPAQGSGKTIYPIEPAGGPCTPTDCDGVSRARNRGKNYQRQSARERSVSPQSYENVPDTSEGMNRQASHTQSGILKRSSRPSSRRTRSPHPSETICPQLTGNICPNQRSGSICLSQMSNSGGVSMISSTLTPPDVFEKVSEHSQNSGTQPQHNAIIPRSPTPSFPSNYSGEDLTVRRPNRGVCPAKRSGNAGNNAFSSRSSSQRSGSFVCASQRGSNLVCASPRSSKTVCPSKRKQSKPCPSSQLCNEPCTGKGISSSPFSSKSTCPPPCPGTGILSTQPSQSVLCPSKFSDYVICSSDNSDLLVCTSENSGYSFHNSDDTSSQPTQSNYSIRKRHRGEGPKRSPSFRCSTILNRANISSKISISVKKTKVNRSSQPASTNKKASKPSVITAKPSQESTRNPSKPNVTPSKNTVCYPLLLSGIPHWNMYPSNNNLADSSFAKSISNHSQPPLGRQYSPTDTSEIVRPFSQPCGKNLHPFIFSGRGARPFSRDSDILHSFPRSVSSPPSRLGSAESYRVSDNLRLVSDPSSHFREPATLRTSFSNKSISSFLSPENVEDVFRSASYHAPGPTSSRSLLFVFSPLRAPDPPVNVQEQSQSSDKRSSSA